MDRFPQRIIAYDDLSQTGWIVAWNVHDMR